MSEPTPWTRDDVERWLTDFPLPADFVYNGEKVWPRYALKCGYGQWLRTAGPYHKALRGLFVLIYEIVRDVPVGNSLPTVDQLVDQIKAIEAAQLELTFSEEDIATASPGRHPAAGEDITPEKF